MWREEKIETVKGTFQYFFKGDGPPLAVTHLFSEFNERGNNFADKFTAHYSVYLINLRGCGESASATSTDQFSMIEAVKDLEAIRIALNVPIWSFAGHSTGGMLALKYAIESPQSVNKIIAGGLSASNEYMKHPDSIYCKKNKDNPRILEIIEKLGQKETPIEERRALVKEWGLMYVYNKHRYDEMIKRPNSGKVVSNRLDYYSYEELPSYDLRPYLVNVNVPAYIYSGLHDRQCPHVFSKEAADLIPNATFTTFSNSNHNPFMEEESAFEDFVVQTIQKENNIDD
ncbi:prolyl aminopeptidase (proline iminopeptidase) [Oceanobacillus iheyensis HTE831]|uniref:Prolyl aminopeptidase (Proline iminopeptidase) n=1 Tax=Oceanobacillus iheyensis (strain DSM 14371 / CIP 107618 / JCM 11309 / KCTC 3954 / HTE831) TaxID=221109 RepID=Q8CUR2_OCEIH|nr:alpha/beta hydrolase [Oceanobacillus iheyensis]BAC13001.1 prolyl aminopeptidase (proline iminopeptidase) [Oceanobacillus iheyensis HTE831]